MEKSLTHSYLPTTTFSAETKPVLSAFCITFQRYFTHEVKALVAQSCLTLCDPMDCSQSRSSVHRFLQARILEWAAISFSRGSSQPKDWTQVSCTAADSSPSEPPGKPKCSERKALVISHIHKHMCMFILFTALVTSDTHSACFTWQDILKMSPYPHTKKLLILFCMYIVYYCMDEP